MSRNAQPVPFCALTLGGVFIMEEKKARKTDRRIEKTKQAMRHAFVELLKKSLTMQSQSQN